MNDAFIRCFVESFAVKDVTVLDPFLHPNIVFQNYEDAEVRGKDKVLDLWKRVFGMFEVIRFETLHQAVNGDVIIAEQMHGLSLPGKSLAPIKNMAIYELQAGKIAAWRDYYSDSAFNRTLL